MDLVNRLSWLFGTEETVKYRRQSVLLREEISTKYHNARYGCECSIICSGSLGEGVAYPPSDDDIMIGNRRQSLIVYDRCEEAINHRALYMIPSVCSPGFCLLQTTYVTATGLCFLSSKEFREDDVQRMMSTGLDYYLHGPCASIEVGPFEYDFAHCLLCRHWPYMANEWILRKRRHGWPSPDLVEKIVKSGCHVVPIGNPDSPLCDLEWRVSFSLAERSLIHAFNHVQFLVYNLLKLTLKGFIAVRIENVLCSYFLKTVLFYTIENTSREIWVNNAIEECYRKCLSLLYYFIDAKNCPNYFVPDNNMMRRKVNESNKVPLLRIIRELIGYGITGLNLCGENNVPFPQFPSHAQIELEFQSDKSLLRGYHMFALIRDFDTFIRQQYESNVSYITTTNVLSPLLSSCKRISGVSDYADCSFLNLIIKRVFTLMGLQCIETSTRAVERNTSRYQMLKCAQAKLQIGSNSDISSGKLQLAYFMFMTGRYRHCLAILQVVLSNIPPYVMHLTARQNSAEDAMYMDFMCNNVEHSLDYRARKAWAFHVTFSTDRATSAPLPVKIIMALACIKVSQYCAIHLDPLLFSYFLQGLCYYQTRDFDSMNNSVALLEESVKSLPMESLGEILSGRLLQGYMKRLQQDYNSSCRCFTSAYLMIDAMCKRYKQKSFEYESTCLICIGCLLSRIARTR